MIHPLSDTNIILSSEPLSFMRDRRTDIERYWNSVMTGKDRLWNGEFFMFTDVHIEDGVLHARGHKTDFSTFLYWRDNGRDPSVTHITGTSFPHFDDGSLLAIKMAEHTANAGKVYFPAGSFDSDDIVDGAFDVVTNFCREIKEEIGIDVDASTLSGPLLATYANNAYHIGQAMCLPDDFETLRTAWKHHRANGGDDEIEGLVQIVSEHNIPLEMQDYAAALCCYHFERWSQRANLA